MSIDFYVRVFVRVYTSAAESKESSCRLSYIWQSSGCDSYWLQPVGQKRVSAVHDERMSAVHDEKRVSAVHDKSLLQAISHLSLQPGTL